MGLNEVTRDAPRTAPQMFASVLAPIIASFVVTGMVALSPWMSGPISAREFVNLSLIAASWSAPVSLLIGLPWHAFAYSRRWRSAIAYWAPGLLVGAALPTAVLAPFGLAREYFLLIAWPGAVGCATGLIAWLIRRPDRDAPPSQETP